MLVQLKVPFIFLLWTWYTEGTADVGSQALNLKGLPPRKHTMV